MLTSPRSIEIDKCEYQNVNVSNALLNLPFRNRSIAPILAFWFGLVHVSRSVFLVCLYRQ